MNRVTTRQTEPRQWDTARWVVPVFALAAVALMPWIVVLVRTLPSMHHAAHWDVAWGGFDVVLALLLLAVAVAAWRRSPWLQGVAAAAAALLLVDAWFDVLTSSSQTELTVATGEALLAELPLAVLCLVIATRARQRLEDSVVVIRPGADTAGGGPSRLRRPLRSAKQPSSGSARRPRRGAS